MSTPELDHMRAWGERWGRGMAERSGAHRVANLEVTPEAFAGHLLTVLEVIDGQAAFITGLFREETGEAPPAALIEVWRLSALVGFGRAVQALEMAAV